MHGGRFLFLIFIAILFVIVFVWDRQLFFGIRAVIGLSQCADRDALRLENETLRERMLMGAPPLAASTSLLSAPVYALYPFNNQNALVVALGSDEGVRKGMPATVGGEVLVGQVIEVFRHRSVVRTIISPDSQIPVRIGSRKVPGLFIGGPAPRIFMIPADQAIAVGDRIISASSDAPYGLRIGTIASLSSGAQGGVFQEAVVVLGYDSDGLTNVDLMVWTPD